MKHEENNNFNRSYNLSLKFKKKLFDLNILFNNFNTYTSYFIKKETYHTLKNCGNKLNVCFDIKRSLFCNTFLDFDDKKCDSCNLVNSFNGIYTQFKDLLYYDIKETITLGKILSGSSFIENKLDINVFKLYKFPDDFVFCICNRQFVNDKTKKRFVRSSTFSMYSNDCNNYLFSLYKKYKTDGGKLEDCETAMESLFDNGKPNMTPQQLQNGFQL